MIDLARAKAAYRALPPGRRASPRLEALAARVANRLFGRASGAPARILEAKLLGGFAGPAEADLQAMAAAPETHPRRAAEAAWALARWHADRGAPALALDALATMRARLPGAHAAEARLVEADCLIRLGRTAEARALLDPVAAADPEAALLRAAAEDAATPAGAAVRLAWVAAAFGLPGGLEPADPARPLGLDNLDGPERRPVTGLISVIVPVHGEDWRLVPGLLAALAAQTLSPDRFEAILVNNAGPLPDPAPAPPPGAGFAWRVLDCPAPGSYAARNFGAARARGALLVFTDADCLPGPGWLAALAEAAATAPGRLLAGPVRMTGAETPAGARPNPCAAYDRLRGIPQERYVRLGYAATANLAVPRAVFDAQGGFDATRFSGGDAAFCRTAGRAGVAIELVPGAAVGHPVRADWAALSVKARRVKGGQILGGAPRARAVWLVRSLTPPLRATLRFARAPAPWPERRAAIGALYRLWGVELAEIVRLAAGGAPERR